MKGMDEYSRLEERNDFALMKDVSYGNAEAFSVLVDRYMPVVSRTSFRILCDREDSEYVAVRVFVSLWKDIMEYDDRFTLEEWLLRKTCLFSRIRILRRRFLRVCGVSTDVFVNASPEVEDADDFVTKQAWELYCRAAAHMTPLQSAAYALCVLEEIPEDVVAAITGMTHFRISVALDRAEEKVRYELRRFDRDNDYGRYNGFLRKVAERLTDMERLRKAVTDSI